MLVHEAIADQLLERLAGAVRVLVVGQAEALGIDVPPVIEHEAQERVAATRARRASRAGSSPAPAARRRRLVLSGDRRRRSPRVAGAQEEIFGPLLAVQRVRDVEHACDVVDELSFALTGGLFTRNPAPSAGSGSARPSATCTSTAGSPARWWPASRSAAIACPAPG